MKKTVSVNIKGMNFMIEEDAYELLGSYLKRLENHLSAQKGYQDILDDIELRIAELCQSFLSDKKSVIEKSDIESIITTLGQPEQFLDGEEEPRQQQTTAQDQPNQNQGDRILYRDVDQAKIAGICAGLANYFHMDVLLVRVIFLLFLFVGGFGIPLYIILWIVIPKATSTIDRLKMQGKPITVDSVREEVEQAAERVANSSQKFASHLRKEGTVGRRFSAIGSLIRKVFGIGMILFGTGMLIVLLFFTLGQPGFIPIEGENGFLSLQQFLSLTLSGETDGFWLWFAGTVTASTIILFLISNGTYLLLQIRNSWTKLASIALFITGMLSFALCVYFGIKASGDWITEAEIEREIATYQVPELVLESLKNDHTQQGGFTVKEGRRFGFMHIKNERIYNDGVEVIYRMSDDSLYHVYENFTADGRLYEQALKRAKHIRHRTENEGSVLKIAPTYSFPQSDKLRDQEVRIIIEVPKGKWVRVGQKRISPEYLVDDYDEEQSGYFDADGEYEHWD